MIGRIRGAERIMTRHKGGGHWMQRHVADPYVRQARAAGYRSRAAFKLLEIDRRDGLLRTGMSVVDLGAAPGSWTQVAVRRAGPAGLVVGIDLLPVEPVPGAIIVQGDIREESALRDLEALLPPAGADLVLSDLAPNLSGIAATDQARATELGELALEFARRRLKSGGDLLVKAFHGAGFDDLRQAMSRLFRGVAERKPAASRGSSAEVYLLGRGKL